MRNPSKYGKIEAAAIFFEGKVYSLPPPARHHSVLRLIFEELEKAGRPPFVRGEEQGFLTTSGNFIRRKPAVIIAIEAGQIAEPK